MMDNYSKIRRQKLIICLFLVAASLLIYSQSVNFDFVYYDDESYVTENPFVKAGLTHEGIYWAFTSGYAANWHPLTWLSHMLDVDLYGLNPMGHHWTNLQIHIVNTILLFLVLNWMTGALWQSSLVAALFAVHPLHVESVAWVAERKDLLCALFWLLSIWAYAGYVRYGTAKRYILLIVFFFLGILSKPMIVTLPFVLLLLDFWPLSRFRSIAQERKIPEHRVFITLVWEKIPLFVLSAGLSIITFLVQKHGGTVFSIKAIPLTTRISNAIVSYVSYMGKMIMPVNLAVFYPYRNLAAVQVVISILVLLLLSVLVIRYLRKFPYLATGWLWYMGTLVPVIGLVQVGSQSMADRYTYIPLTGLFIILVWGGTEIADRWKRSKIKLAAVSTIILLLLTVCAYFQVRYWQNRMTLFTHALAVTQNNSIAHNELGNALEKQGRPDKAMEHYREALRIDPFFGDVHFNMGTAFSHKGDDKAAIYHYKKALMLMPNSARAHNNLGSIYTRQGNVANALYHYNEAIRINPGYAGAYYNLGKIYAGLKRVENAIFNFKKALQYSPNMTQALYSLAWLFATHENRKFRNGAEAIKLAETLCKITRYEQPLALDVLAAAYAETGEFDNAASTAQKALELALPHGPEKLTSGLKRRLHMYETGSPYHQKVDKNGS